MPFLSNHSLQNVHFAKMQALLLTLRNVLFLFYILT